MNSTLSLAWRNLFRNPRRTMASLLTVALGAAGMLVFQGFNTGIMNQYRENTVRGYYGYGQVFPAGYHGKVLEKPWEKWIENADEVERTLRAVPNVVEVYPRVSFFAFLVRGGINLGGRGEGIVAQSETKFFTQMNFIDGRNLVEDDEIVIGKGLADSLGVKAGDIVTVLTQTINGQLNGADLKVSGVFHMGIKAIDDQFFRLPLKTAQSLLDTNRIELFALQTTGVPAWPQVEENVEKADANLDAISFDVLDKVFYQNAVDFLQAQFNFIRTIILLIVALGIFNTIAVGLLERAGEIGALRANGESRARLFRILMSESALLGFIGGCVGSLVALLLHHTVLSGGIPMPPSPGITRQYLIMLEMQESHFFQALAMPMAATVVASIWPIRKLLVRSIPDLLRST